MTVRVHVEPALLHWAVKRAGWPREKLTKRFPKFDDWVNGNVQPTLKQLESFAHSTHAPLGLLFLPTPPDEPVPIPDMRTLRNQAIEQPSADLLDTIYSCQSRQEWYRDYANTHGHPTLDFAGSARVSNNPKEVASKIRSMLHFSVSERTSSATWQEALRSLIDRIENLGVLVMVSGIVGADTHRKLNPEEFRGFALADPVAPLIFVNGADTKAAQIFTMVHELAHIWLGESALSDAPMASKAENSAELWCNRVAAEVLVPLDDIRRDYTGNLTVAELERLSRRYRVSTLVVLKRLYDAHFLRWDDYQERYSVELSRIKAIMKASEGTPGGDFYNTHPLRLSRQFARAVISDTYEGGTAFRDAYHLLGTKKHETFQNLAEKIGAA
ncbi:ImmA/IrrE family metallo-endopeptidase [Streptomyces sp. WA6-1-16]|uniref:ImmA/IrrE family metallo-endopeptidase n=1 Tax=Streptomyces sp. WA6-1-16 TaxID=2879427 RepID=UPI001CE2A67A|nr:ImmA/IrrE family metallo-endopeptidase [Streptomyces sp. WA6-1-16]UCA48533.1 ImmA/IrrE family metallo-endopeptidase [Streptomyces sp. WA6-1-16]